MRYTVIHVFGQFDDCGLRLNFLLRHVLNPFQGVDKLRTALVVPRTSLRIAQWLIRILSSDAICGLLFES